MVRAQYGNHSVVVGRVRCASEWGTGREGGGKLCEEKALIVCKDTVRMTRQRWGGAILNKNDAEFDKHAAQETAVESSGIRQRVAGCR